MRPTAFPAWISLALAACGGEDDDTDPTGAASPGAFLAGTWSPDDGGAVLETPWLGELAWLSFAPSADGGSSGTLGLYGELESGLQVCEHALYDASGAGFLALFSQSALSGARGLLLEGDAAGFTLTSELGFTEAFTPEAGGLPASAACQGATEGDRASFDLDRTSFGSLLYDGTSVRVSVEGGTIAVDVPSGTIGGFTGFNASYDQLLTQQGADAWGHCGCGGSQEIVRSSPGGAIVDEIDTEDLGVKLNINMAAWDGSTLWVGGYSHDLGEAQLLAIDSNAEPDVLLSQTPLGDLNASRMTWHDGALYAVAHDSIVRLDTGTGRVVETWRMPSDLSNWTAWGFTSDGTSFYVAYDTAPETVIVRVEL